jgi:hypothetical protein
MNDLSHYGKRKILQSTNLFLLPGATVQLMQVTTFNNGVTRSCSNQCTRYVWEHWFWGYITASTGTARPTSLPLWAFISAQRKILRNFGTNYSVFLIKIFLNGIYKNYFTFIRNRGIYLILLIVFVRNAGVERDIEQEMYNLAPFYSNLLPL